MNDIHDRRALYGSKSKIKGCPALPSSTRWTEMGPVFPPPWPRCAPSST
jgi:hypothetical protein